MSDPYRRLEGASDPEELIERVDNGEVSGTNKPLAGPFSQSFHTAIKAVDRPGAAPLPRAVKTGWGQMTPSATWLRASYAVPVVVVFTLIVTTCASIIGIITGAVQGYFGGWTDLLFQRFQKFSVRSRRFTSSSFSLRF